MVSSNPANFDSDIFDALLADWMAGLRTEAVEAIMILSPNPLQIKEKRVIRAVHPPRFLGIAQALIDSDDLSTVQMDADAPLAMWQDISRGNYSDLARWRTLALAHGLQTVVRVAFNLPRGQAFECYLMSPRALHDKSEAAALVWSTMNIWPRVKKAIAAITCPLSPREKECLALALDGLTANDTALKLDCSERTVNYYLANAMRKFNVDNKLAAIEKAMWYGAI